MSKSAANVMISAYECACLKLELSGKYVRSAETGIGHHRGARRDPLGTLVVLLASAAIYLFEAGPIFLT